MMAAADGASALNGAKLAVAQANAAGGIGGKPIELVVYDDQASPKEAVPAVTKMIENTGRLGRPGAQWRDSHRALKSRSESGG